MAARLSMRDMALALVTMLIWGANFAVIHIGLQSFPPLFFGALRFTFVVLPLALFLKRPSVDGRPVPWRNLIGYGLAMGPGQFSLLFIAMHGLISPGMASLVVQCQVFFTIGFAMLRQGERLGPVQIAALGMAVAGIALIMAHNNADARALGVAMTLGSAFFWAVSNQFAREAGRMNVLAYLSWAALFAAPPLFLLSVMTEGWPAIWHSVQTATPAGWAAMLWQGWGNTLMGYGVWAWLLTRYPASTVAPMSLLVPISGFATAALLVGEPIQAWKIEAALLVMAGLAVNLFWRRPKA